MSDSEGEAVKNQDIDESSGSEVEDNNDDDATETEYEGGAIKKKIITKGTGYEKPKSGADVTVHYVGTLLDGTQFDSSRDRGTPFNFKLGQGMVIKGWDKGVATMKKGEKALFTIAASHAYGDRAQGSIPPNSTLQFEVELLSWTSEEDVIPGGAVKKTTIQEGKGWEKPDELAIVALKYSIKTEGKFVLGGDAPVEAQIDLASVDMPEGFVEAVKKMKKGERAKVTVAGSYGYGKEGNSALKIGPDATLEYDIELVDFPDSPKTYSMKNEEKLAHGNKLKDAGNAFFKKEQIKRAKHFYEEATNLFQHEKNLEGAIKKQVDQLVVAAKGNLAACNLKLQEFGETIKVANEVLEQDAENVKVLFRRAQAYYARKDYDEALEDLKEVIAKEGGKVSAAVGKVLKEVKSAIAQEREAQAKIFGGMFSKLSLVSDSEVAEAKATAERNKQARDPDDSEDDEPPPMEEADKPEEVKEAPKEAAKAAATTEDAEDGGEGEEMTPEQAAAMAAMNDELFGIVEEGQAGLAAEPAAKAEAPKKTEASSEKKVEAAAAEEGEEEMTPEQAAAMAAMNDELFGIVEEGQAGLASETKTEAPKKAEASSEKKAEAATEEGGEEEMTPEQAAAMAAMNDELFGIVEEGQAGLASAPAAKEEAPKEEKKKAEEKPKAEEPAVSVHVPPAAATPEPAAPAAAPAAAAPAKGGAKGADKKPAEAKKPAAGGAKGKGKK